MSEIKPTLCACMGPIGDDPHCPCVMKQKGLTPTNLWTPEAIAALDTALKKLEQTDTQNDLT